MIRVYRAPWSTNCERVSLALGHKNLEAESVMIDYSDRRPVEEVSGQPLVPVIVDDGRVVPDSVAIMHHLDDRYGEPLLFPPEDPARVHSELFVDWFDEVYKHAPNAIEAELACGEPVRRGPPRGRRRALPRDPGRAAVGRGPAEPGGVDRPGLPSADGVPTDGLTR